MWALVSVCCFPEVNTSQQCKGFTCLVASRNAANDAKDAALELLRLAFGSNRMPDSRPSTGVTQPTAPASHGSSTPHPLLMHWLPATTPTSEIASPNRDQSPDLHLQLLQQAQSQLHATHSLTELCQMSVHEARKLPANSNKQVQQWRLLAELLGICNEFVSQLQFQAPKRKSTQPQKKVRTKLRGTVHTLSFTMNDDAEAGWTSDDAEPVQSALLSLAQATGEADRQVDALSFISPNTFALYE